MTLSAQELNFYHERGYVLKTGLFTPEFIEKLAREVDGLHEKMATDKPPYAHVAWEENLAPDRPRRIRQLMGSEKVSPLLDAISRDARVLDILEQLMGPDIYLYHSKLMMKAAHDGSFTPWHQDWGYWRYHFHQPTQVNMMLAIDPADESNGAIRFVAGSHQRGPIEHKRIQSTSFSIGLEGGIDAYESELVTMSPGDAVFFGSLVIHGSGPNTSPRHRRANTFAFDRPGNHLSADKEFPAENWRRGRQPATV